MSKHTEGRAPVTISTTVAVWLSSGSNPARELTGEAHSIVGNLAFYGMPDRSSFGDWIRVGEADVVVRLIPRDEQVRMAVEALNKKLNEARAEWLTRQQEILAEISKLQALEFTDSTGVDA